METRPQNAPWHHQFSFLSYLYDLRRVDRRRVEHETWSTIGPMEPFTSLRWRAVIRTRDAPKLQAVTTAIADAVGHPLEALTLSRYHKDPATTEATFLTPLPATTAADAVFGTLMQATTLAHHWTTFGPTTSDGERWEFELLCGEKFLIPRLTWAHCSALNH
jgi:hypothetical protein